MNTAPSSFVALDAMRHAALSTLSRRVPRAVIVYGSFGRFRQAQSSDLDVLFVGESNPAALATLTKALTDFSRKHGLALDEEVPYATKLLSSPMRLEFSQYCSIREK